MMTEAKLLPPDKRVLFLERILAPGAKISGSRSQSGPPDSNETVSYIAVITESISLCICES